MGLQTQKGEREYFQALAVVTMLLAGFLLSAQVAESKESIPLAPGTLASLLPAPKKARWVKPAWAPAP